jgi:hypothetical protein
MMQLDRVVDCRAMLCKVHIYSGVYLDEGYAAYRVLSVTSADRSTPTKKQHQELYTAVEIV